MTIEDYRAQARARFGALTPYRLGFMVGLADDDRALCPYEAWHSAQLFDQGHAAGLESRRRAQAALDRLAGMP